MKIYIAAKYAKRYALRGVANCLEREGYVVTSRWLQNGDGAEGGGIYAAATMDVEDVRAADCLVFIGEPQASENRGGGRWWEFGYAYALGKPCIAVLDTDPTKGGHDHLPIGHESVFTALPDVKVLCDPDINVLLAALAELAQFGEHRERPFSNVDLEERLLPLEPGDLTA